MLQTGVPPGVCRNSGSLVRLPTRTTRLTFAIALLLLLDYFLGRLLFRVSVLRLARLRNGRCGRGRFGRDRLGRGRDSRCLVARCTRARAGDVAGRQVAQHGVLDLKNAGDLGERVRLRVEDDEVIDAFLLVRDRIGEAAPAPGIVALPRAAALFDEV